jgi:hypothetical protein
MRRRTRSTAADTRASFAFAFATRRVNGHAAHR